MVGPRALLSAPKRRRVSQSPDALVQSARGRRGHMAERSSRGPRPGDHDRVHRGPGPGPPGCRGARGERDDPLRSGREIRRDRRERAVPDPLSHSRPVRRARRAVRLQAARTAGGPRPPGPARGARLHPRPGSARGAGGSDGRGAGGGHGVDHGRRHPRQRRAPAPAGRSPPDVHAVHGPRSEQLQRHRRREPVDCRCQRPRQPVRRGRRQHHERRIRRDRRLHGHLRLAGHWGHYRLHPGDAGQDRGLHGGVRPGDGRGRQRHHAERQQLAPRQPVRLLLTSGWRAPGGSSRPRTGRSTRPTARISTSGSA
jgi:hypothetical protein